MILKILIITFLSYLYSFGSVNLNNENFETTIKIDKITIIDFYADWCKSCIKLQEFIDKNEYQTFKINDEDELNKNLSEKYNIKVYPTIIVFKNGLMINKVTGLYDSKLILKKYNIKVNK